MTQRAMQGVYFRKRHVTLCDLWLELSIFIACGSVPRFLFRKLSHYFEGGERGKRTRPRPPIGRGTRTQA